ALARVQIPTRIVLVVERGLKARAFNFNHWSVKSLTRRIITEFSRPSCRNSRPRKGQKPRYRYRLAKCPLSKARALQRCSGIERTWQVSACRHLLVRFRLQPRRAEAAQPHPWQRKSDRLGT